MFWLVSIWSVAAFWQIFYYGYWLGKFSITHPQDAENTSFDPRPVSVVIAAKNEAENLRKNLPEILLQDYPAYEVVVVNDASTDGTAPVLKDLKEQYPALTVIDIPARSGYAGNKKNALTEGIRKAKYDYLVFTDADCVPASRQWLRLMSRPLHQGKDLVLGYGAYRRTAGFLNRMIRYETLLTAWQYFAYYRHGIPYMGVGRNIAYTKNFFGKTGGFASPGGIRSGDDDLLVNRYAVAEHTAVVTDPGAFTVSQPETSWGKWFRQKKRHLTTAFYYRPVHRYMLAAFYLSQLVFPAGWLWLTTEYATMAAVILGLRYLTAGSGMYFAGKKLNEHNLVPLFPVLEVVLAVFQLWVFASHLIQPRKKW